MDAGTPAPDGPTDMHPRPEFPQQEQPVELAPVYVFLASPKAAYITGEIVSATGGTPLP